MSYTLDQVKDHNSREDCWIVINDKVYDITDFIPIHPGGTIMIVRVAGTDASDYFNNLHQPEILDTIGSEYYIGDLQTTTALAPQTTWQMYANL